MTDQPLAPAFASVQGPDQSILLLVGRMDAKLDLLLLADAKQDLEIGKLGERLSALETWRSRALGGWAVVTGAGALFGSYVISHIWR